MTSDTLLDASRRTFLKAAPAAAAALSVPALRPAAAQVAAAQPAALPPVPFQLISAATIAADAAQLSSAPGVKELFPAKDLPMVMNITVEAAKSAAEFEYHEHRAHIFQILDGATRYEIGGTLREPRQIRPGEWLAKSSDGFKTIELAKGDVLMIPRMTPHRRVTAAQVTFYLTNVTDPGDPTAKVIPASR